MHPEKIGPYVIHRKIGSGGMGNVYFGTHEETDEPAAVKVLPASMAREEGFVHRFSREIDALRKVSSPNIVQIFLDGQTDDGSYFFSMEFVDGETLTSMVTRRKRIPWSEVIDISCQICTALKAAHNAGIVHRDLKPSNLMIAKDGTVKLADFGVAHVFASTRLTRTGGIVGTAEYMSPEQAGGKRATKLSDLYSLGAVMYVMLTGRPPFTGQTAADILQKHQFSQFDRPGHYVPDLPRRLEQFVCQLLEKRPEKRFPDAFVVLRQLSNIRGRIEFEQENRQQTAVPQESDSNATSGFAADRTSGQRADSVEMSRGPATIVRDAIRADLLSEKHKSPVGRFFDNTFVLIALLILVVVTGIYLSRQTEPSAEERLAEAAEIISGSPGRDWIRARDELLLPLSEGEELPQKAAEIRSLIRRVDHYEFSDGLQSSAHTDGTAETEIQRLIADAFARYANGAVVESIEQLQAIRDLLTADDEFLRDFLNETIKSWNEDQRVTGRKALLKQIIARAEAASDGKSEEAINQLRATISLYGDDVSVAAEVDHCRALLNRITSGRAEPSEGTAAESPE